MDDGQLLTLLSCLAGDLKRAARVRSNRKASAGAFNIFHLAAAEARRHLGLREIVRTGGAATEFRFRQVANFEARNLSELVP